MISISVAALLYNRGLKLKLLCGPHEDLQGNPWAA